MKHVSVTISTVTCAFWKCPICRCENRQRLVGANAPPCVRCLVCDEIFSTTPSTPTDKQ